MDSKNNIDQLFREKVFSQEVAPSAMAWDQVSRKINKKKPVMIYWIAASISAIILISLVVWPSSPSSDSQVIADVTHPILGEKDRLIIPEKSMDNLSPSIAKTSMKKSSGRHSSMIAFDQIKTKFVAMETMNIIAKKPDINTAWPVQYLGSIVKYEQVETPIVKITYIASNQQVVDTVEAKGINKFWSVAQNLTNTSVLADLRDAKNNLFVKNQP